jgi:hypothetical protein
MNSKEMRGYLFLGTLFGRGLFFLLNNLLFSRGSLSGRCSLLWFFLCTFIFPVHLFAYIFGLLDEQSARFSRVKRRECFTLERGFDAGAFFGFSFSSPSSAASPSSSGFCE